MISITEHIRALLGAIFDQGPDAAFFLHGDSLGYANPPGRELLLPGGALPPALAHLPATPWQGEVSLDGVRWHASRLPLGEGVLLVLRPAQARLFQENQTLGQIAGQLRERLNLLSFQTEALSAGLRRDGVYDQYRMQIAGQLQSVCRLLHITGELELLPLDWPAEFPTERVDLAHLCGQMQGEVGPLAALCGVTLTCQCPPQPVPVGGSFVLLHRMLLSLLSNSIRAAGEGGRAGVRLTLRRGQAQLSVWDSGPGLPPETLAAVFHPRPDRPLPAPGEGAHLGLYLARQIALYHGGALLSSNRQPRGAEILVSLPLQEDGPLPLYAPDQGGRFGGFPPALVALADLLPRDAFLSFLEE